MNFISNYVIYGRPILTNRQYSAQSTLLLDHVIHTLMLLLLVGTNVRSFDTYVSVTIISDSLLY